MPEGPPDPNAEQVIEASPMTDEDKFWVGWWIESPKLNLALLRDILSKFITLAASLAGGSAAFLKDDYAPLVFRQLAIACFFVAMVLACIGIYPRTDSAGPQREQIEDSKKRAFDRMQLWLILASIAMCIGFGAIILGPFFK